MHGSRGHDVVKVGRVENGFQLRAVTLAAKRHLDDNRARDEVRDDAVEVAVMPDAGGMHLDNVAKHDEKMGDHLIPGKDSSHISATSLTDVETEEDEQGPTDTAEQAGRHVQVSIPKVGGESGSFVIFIISAS